MRLALLALLSVFFALPVLGAVGDAYQNNFTHQSGSSRVLKSSYLCDGNEVCGSLDFSQSPGIPDYLVLEIIATDCSTTSISITTSPDSALAGYDPDGTTITMTATNDRVIIKTREIPMDRFLIANATASSGCTDLELVVHQVHKNR